MKFLRKIMIFILFLALFSTVTWALFGGALKNMAVNVRTGAGTTEYSLVTRSPDGKIYALGHRDGPRLVCGTDTGREYDRKIKSGLPESFSAVDIRVTGWGAVLLTLESYDGAAARRGLYYSENGRDFRTLLDVNLSDGDKLSSVSEFDGKLWFFEKNGSTYVCYSFDPSQPEGLKKSGSFNYEGNMLTGIITDSGEAYIAVRGEIAWFDVSGNNGGRLDSSRLHTRLMQAADGFSYIDGGSGSLIVFSCADKTESLLSAMDDLPCPPGDINNLSVVPDGGILVLDGYTKLYSKTPGGGFTDQSSKLYGTAWKSAALLAVIFITLAVLAFCFYHLFCQVRKMYFPIALRSLLTVGLITFLLVSAVSGFYIKPWYTENMRELASSALSAYARYFTHGNRDTATGSIMLSSYGLEGVNIHILTITPDGPRLLMSTSEVYAPRDFSSEQSGSGWFLADCPEALGDYTGVIDDAPCTQTVIKAGKAVYAALEPTGNGAVLVTANGRGAEADIEAFHRWLDLITYALTIITALFCSVTLQSVSNKVGRVIKGVDRLAAGNYSQTVKISTGDEMQALAGAINNLAGLLKKQLTGEHRRSASYLQFLPQQLVSLMGVSKIEEIDKSTTASRDMAVILVWFSFPGDMYQSDPQALFYNINEVINRTSGVVTKNSGTIYDFAYDRYSAVFPSGPSAAVSAAVEIRQGIIALNRERSQRGIQPVTLHVSIDKGNVMMGVVGDDSRMVPTAVSAGLNTSRLLNRLSRTLSANILCTMEVADEAKSYFVRYIGKMLDPDKPIRVYEIVDGDELSARESKEKTQGQFSQGIYSLYSRDFSAAKRMFMDIARHYGGDGIARHYLYLSDKYEKEPPNEVYLSY